MEDTIYSKRKDLANMIYTFDCERVTLDDVANFAHGTWYEDDSFKVILIRDTKQGEFGLQVIVEIDETPESHKVLLDKMTDALKKKFGNGLKGWNGSNRTIFIKGLDELRK